MQRKNSAKLCGHLALSAVKEKRKQKEELMKIKRKEHREYAKNAKKKLCETLRALSALCG